MNTTLCFDFGNTRLKYGTFINGQLSEIVSLADDSNETIEQLLKKYKPEKIILSSVINHNTGIEKIMAEASSFHKLSSQTILPFTTPVGKPETIGTDRLALAAAAVHFYKGKNNLVIGLGSCVTYNFINKYTAKLPLIKADWNFPLIGYDTRTNILSGVLMGLATEIDGIIDDYEEKFSNFNVLLTGGDAHYFAHHLKNKIFVDPDLIFKGLYAISETNDGTNI